MNIMAALGAVGAVAFYKSFGFLLVVLIAFVGGLSVMAFVLLGKQQRLYRQTKGPPDLRRADDAERGPQFDPDAIRQAGEDFYAGGARPAWMRGVGDDTLDDDYKPRRKITEPHKATSGQWETSDQEGWFPDPFGRHEVRWISGGSPTRLVRDHGVESQDDPLL